MSGNKGVSKTQADVLAKFRQSQARNAALVAEAKRAQEERAAKAKADPSKAAAGAGTWMCWRAESARGQVVKGRRACKGDGGGAAARSSSPEASALLPPRSAR